MLDKSQHALRLGITERELQALLDVRDDLESGVIPARAYRQGSTCEVTWCGTVACIGGHMAIRMGCGDEAADQYVTDAEVGPLSNLFWGEMSNFITPSQAVAAIDRWIASEGREAW